MIASAVVLSALYACWSTAFVTAAARNVKSDLLEPEGRSVSTQRGHQCEKKERERYSIWREQKENPANSEETKELTDIKLCSKPPRKQPQAKETKADRSQTLSQQHTETIATPSKQRCHTTQSKKRKRVILSRPRPSPRRLRRSPRTDRRSAS